jgi:SlyX protein
MGDSLTDSASRVDALEMRFTHQERIVADLNEVITAQWSKIDALQREIVKLREEFDAIAFPRDRPEPPPPHY